MILKDVIKEQAIEFDNLNGLHEEQRVEVEIQPDKVVSLEQYGFRPIPAGGKPVTNEMVKELREELGI